MSADLVGAWDFVQPGLEWANPNLHNIPAEEVPFQDIPDDDPWFYWSGETPVVESSPDRPSYPDVERLEWTLVVADDDTDAAFHTARKCARQLEREPLELRAAPAVVAGGTVVRFETAQGTGWLDAVYQALRLAAALSYDRLTNAAVDGDDDLVVLASKQFTVAKVQQAYVRVPHGARAEPAGWGAEERTVRPDGTWMRPG